MGIGNGNVKKVNVFRNGIKKVNKFESRRKLKRVNELGEGRR